MRQRRGEGSGGSPGLPLLSAPLSAPLAVALRPRLHPWPCRRSSLATQYSSVTRPQNLLIHKLQCAPLDCRSDIRTRTRLTAKFGRAAQPPACTAVGSGRASAALDLCRNSLHGSRQPNTPDPTSLRCSHNDPQEDPLTKRHSPEQGPGKKEAWVGTEGRSVTGHLTLPPQDENLRLSL